LIATVSTVVVIGGLALAILTSPGWEDVQRTFFSWEVFRDSFPDIFKAFWLDIRPRDVVSIAAAGEQPGEGFFLAPARDFTVENFILDPGEPGRAATKPPPGFELVAENRSWKLYTSCVD